MAKLQSFIKTFARTSTIDVICEADSSHVTRKYFHIEVTPPFATMQERDVAILGIDEEMANIIRMKVCANCFVEWLGTIQQTLAEFNV